MKQILSALAIVFGAGAVIIGPTSASAWDLGGTSWWAEDELCEVMSIDFSSGGTAVIQTNTMDEPFSGSWTLNGSSFSLTYIGFSGGIEGTIVSQERIEATATWVDINNETFHDTCSYEPR
jgi:hypothetical protein